MHSAKEPRWMCKVIMKAIQNGASQEFISAKGGIYQTKISLYLIGLHLCIYHSALIIHDWIHTCLAVCHRRKIFLYDEASQDHLPNIN